MPKNLLIILGLTAILTVGCSTGGLASPAETRKPIGADEDVPAAFRGWRTNFDRHSVPLGEIISGGVPPDGIPPIDHPKFVSTSEADGWLADVEPIVLFELNGDVRAYPLQILIWHEIVNDVVGGEPVLITFCPLCNTAIAFKRILDGVVYDFGTTGKLRYSDLVMWDRQTESWWQQITGEAIVGDLTGARLTFLPASVVSWADFKTSFPQGKVLSRDTGHSRRYGSNPYTGYDDVRSSPFLFDGKPDGRLPAMERVVTVTIGGEDKAYPFSVLAEERVVEDTVGGQDIVIFWTPGTASALDRSVIAESRDVGTAAIYDPRLEGRRLGFMFDNVAIRDLETGSMWNILGQAVGGPLAGKRLTPVVHGNHFWFAWAAFKPDTTVYYSPVGQREPIPRLNDVGFQASARCFF